MGKRIRQWHLQQPKPQQRQQPLSRFRQRRQRHLLGLQNRTIQTGQGPLDAKHRLRQTGQGQAVPRRKAAGDHRANSLRYLAAARHQQNAAPQAPPRQIRASLRRQGQQVPDSSHRFFPARANCTRRQPGSPPVRTGKHPTAHLHHLMDSVAFQRCSMRKISLVFLKSMCYTKPQELKF